MNAIIFQTALSLILMLTLNFDSLIYYIAFTLSIFTVLAVLGLMIMRYRHGKPTGYSALGYPVTPLLFILATLAIGFYFVRSNPYESLFGLGTAFFGLLLYIIAADKRTEKS